MRRKKTDSLGLFQVLLFGTLFYGVTGLNSVPMGTREAHAQNAALPFRPIGSESAVDRYRDRRDMGNTDPRATARSRETGFFNASHRQQNNTGNIRQVAMQSGGFTLPSGPGGFNPPPINTPPPLLPGETRPPAQLQPSPAPLQPLNAPGNGNGLAPAPSATEPPFSPPPRSLPNSVPQTQPFSAPMADYQPIAPPQLSNGGFATASDCRLITPPSSYTAMSQGGSCQGYAVAPTGYAAPTGYGGPYIPPPAQIAAPVTMPGYGVPTGPVGPAGAAPVGSLMTFGQQNYQIQVGQGLWGQPVAYVPGQRFRNWLRYLSF